MNAQECAVNRQAFIAQSQNDGRNLPLKIDSNEILHDDEPGVHQPHNGFGYLMHCGWAARKLMAVRPDWHHDFGSYLYFASIASAIVDQFWYYDLRPFHMPLPGLESVKADLTSIGWKDGSLESVSCLHVLEHVGLGRYGDKVDSMGDVKAARELARVLVPGGHLIFVVPVNQQSGVVWNAHRQYTYGQVLNELFPSLQLLEFALIKDKEFNLDSSLIVSHPGNVEDTGCFLFRKP